MPVVGPGPVVPGDAAASGLSADHVALLQGMKEEIRRLREREEELNVMDWDGMRCTYKCKNMVRHTAGCGPQGITPWSEHWLFEPCQLGTHAPCVLLLLCCCSTVTTGMDCIHPPPSNSCLPRLFCSTLCLLCRGLSS